MMNCLVCGWNVSISERKGEMFFGFLRLYVVRTWAHLIVKLFPLIQPHFCNARRILQHDIGDASGERVGRFVAENVAHVGTGSNL